VLHSLLLALLEQARKSSIRPSTCAALAVALANDPGRAASPIGAPAPVSHCRIVRFALTFSLSASAMKGAKSAIFHSWRK